MAGVYVHQSRELETVAKTCDSFTVIVSDFTPLLQRFTWKLSYVHRFAGIGKIYYCCVFSAIVYWSGQRRHSPKQIHIDNRFSSRTKRCRTRKVEVVPNKVTPRSQPLWWVDV